MTCASCGSANKAGAKFCARCGTRLGLACPSCGNPVEAGELFCVECGTPIGSAPPATASVARPAASPPVAERRLVTVLFADLVGFTTIAEGRDPEETRALLSSYFELASDVVGRYGGTVEKFIGDAVMALWGAPTAHEDDAERAVRAALDLVDAVRSIGPGIAARAGVLTGEAAVTIGAVGQGMVAGDLVNTAARLQSVAAEGTVLVGEATHRAASASIAFEEAGEQALKGRAAPVAAWRALRVVAERGGRNRSETLEAPFVGRADELRLLKDLFHATGREGRARLVSVVGPAGIGKSRLAWEFVKYIDGLVEPVWWHDGRSPAYGEGITFWALGEMVRGRCGLVETDDERTTRAKVAETVGRFVVDEAERRWVEPALLALLGLESGIGAEELFGAWRTFFERLAATAPVVMVFEDFHFADPGLIDFVDHLLEWSRNVPIYVATLARPELLERRETWGAGKRNFTSLYLEPLPEEAMRDLLAGLVPGLPASAVRAIVARADGIPLYAIETIRMLLAGGRLVLEGGIYRPVGDLATLAVPETLTALIASRLDGLDATDRALVADAAVLGQSFPLAGLSVVSGAAEAELEPRLLALARREILTHLVDPRSPERGQYAFVQALIREVAYNTLAKPDRKTRHLAAARYFDALGSEELAGALAGHYLAAQRNAPEGTEADALAGQARVALRAAAERAVALGSHEQAIVFYEQALTVTSEPAAEAELLERTGASATAAGRYDLAESSYRRAIDVSRGLGDRRAAARSVALLGESLITGRRTATALALLEPASAEFADLAPDSAVIALDGQLARAYFLNGDHRRAVSAAEPVLEAAEHADLPGILADTLVTKGSALATIGRVQEGTGVIEIGERIARSHGLAMTLLRALRNRSATLGFDIEATAARQLVDEILPLARRLGDRSTLVDTLQTLGWCSALFDGDAETALRTWADLLKEDFEAADRLPILSSIVNLHALRGEPVADDLAELELLVAQVSEPAFKAMPLEAHGWVAFGAGRLGAAQEAWEAAMLAVPDSASFLLAWAARAALWDMDAERVRSYVERLDATGIHRPAVELRRLTLRAGLAALAGATVDALRQYEAALSGWRQMGQAWEEAFAGIDMATLLDPSEPAVRAAAERSREFLQRLGTRRSSSGSTRPWRGPAARPGRDTPHHPGRSRSRRSPPIGS